MLPCQAMPSQHSTLCHGGKVGIVGWKPQRQGLRGVLMVSSLGFVVLETTFIAGVRYAVVAEQGSAAWQRAGCRRLERRGSVARAIVGCGDVARFFVARLFVCLLTDRWSGQATIGWFFYVCVYAGGLSAQGCIGAGIGWSRGVYHALDEYRAIRLQLMGVSSKKRD